MSMKYKTIGLLAVLITQALTITPSRQAAQQSQSTLSPTHIEPVLINVTVTNKAGEFVADLKPDDFEISIDKKPASIASLSKADSPVSVGIVLDSSESIVGHSETAVRRQFAVLREAVGRFLKSGHQSNEYFLIGFNVKPELLVDWSSDQLAIPEKFDGLPVRRNTALYDACYVAVDKLRSGRHTKRALIIMSDGLDNQSKYTFSQVQELLKETDVLLYSIYLAAEMGSAMAIEGRGILEELSSLSGGRLFRRKDGIPLKPKDVNSAFEIIATELRSQYTLSLIPNGSSPGKKWRKIKVKLVPAATAPRQMQDLVVRTRQGFYAH